MTKIWKIKESNLTPKLEFILETNSLDEGSRLLAAGVYTTFRTFQHNQALRLEEHFDRLITSAALKNVTITLDQSKIRQGLRIALENYPSDDVRMRIQLPLNEFEQVIYIMGEHFHPLLKELYQEGAQVQTILMERENPVSKSTRFISDTANLRSAKPENIHEYLMVSKEGELLEGMTSNVFCVVDENIYTAFQGVLPGITRQLAFEAIKDLSINLVPNGWKIKSLDCVDEIFITSASRGVLPVTRINDRVVGNGIPGKMTKAISDKFQQILEGELQVI